MQVSELRALIEREVVSIETYSKRTGRSVHTLLSYTQGRVPQGAQPWPSYVKVEGRTRLYCATELDAWCAAFAPTATPPK